MVHRMGGMAEDGSYSGMTPEPIDSVLVLGGGSAGLLVALAVRRRVPGMRVVLVRSPEIGIIEVGEGSLPYLPKFLHGYLGLDVGQFYREARPTWKLGVKFMWGPREHFHYTFRTQFDSQYHKLSKPTGYYCHDMIGFPDVSTALMEFGMAAFRGKGGVPHVGEDVAYHVENGRFVGYLERRAREIGVEVVEGTVDEVVPGRDGDAGGIGGLKMRTGETMRAGLYVDCTGFQSLLLGKVLGERFIDYSGTLLCDRAVIGGWEREGEPLLPYTTSETMDAGWCWQIEHRERINRGYVYSTGFLSDEAAEAEFRRKNPKLGEVRVVPFRSGIYGRPWRKNVVAVGNAAGFVEPLESTSLGQICQDAQGIAESLADAGGRLSDTMAEQYGERFRRSWTAIRQFLGLHYKLNTRLGTPFWRACVEGCDLAGGEAVLEYYKENGPSTLWRMTLIDKLDQFGFDGYLAMMIGMKVPYANRHVATNSEVEVWRLINANHAAGAKAGMRQEELLPVLESPQWNWDPQFYARMWAKTR